MRAHDRGDRPARDHKTTFFHLLLELSRPLKVTKRLTLYQFVVTGNRLVRLRHRDVRSFPNTVWHTDKRGRKFLDQKKQPNLLITGHLSFVGAIPPFEACSEGLTACKNRRRAYRVAK